MNNQTDFNIQRGVSNNEVNDNFTSIDGRSNVNDDSETIRNPRSSNNSCDAYSDMEVRTKPKLRWTPSLLQKFLKAIDHIGLSKAVPNKILEFMNTKDLTRAHIASKLQRYRQFLKKVQDKEAVRPMSRRTINSNFTSPTYLNPQQSYNYNTSLSRNNILNSQLGYGLCQPASFIPSNNAGLHEPIHYMNHTPTYDSIQTGSNLLPLNEEMRSILGTSQASQTPKFGQYGTTSHILGMNSNLSNDFMHNNYGGINMNDNRDLVGLGGISVNGNGNANEPLGEYLGAMNCGFNCNDNNVNGHGSPTSRFSSTFSPFSDNENQTQSNFIAQTNDVVPVLENQSIFNDNHGINKAFCYTPNSQVYQDQQHQGQVSGENRDLSNNDLLKLNATFATNTLEDTSNWSFGNLKDMSNEETLNSVVGDANLEMYLPTRNVNFINQEHGTTELPPLPMSFDQFVANSNEETLNFVPNSETYFPTGDMNCNQEEQCGENLSELPLSFSQDWDVEDFMNN